MRPAMDNYRGSQADLHPMTVKMGNVELCHVLPRCVSGAGMRFKIGPSNLIERHKRDKNEGKHPEHEESSEGCEEAASWAIVPSSSGRKEWIDLIGPKTYINNYLVLSQYTHHAYKGYGEC